MPFSGLSVPVLWMSKVHIENEKPSYAIDCNLYSNIQFVLLVFYL